MDTFDLLFIGNTSIDEINHNGKTKIAHGGSAFNSSIASSIFKNIKVGINSSIGIDFDISIFKKIKNLNIDNLTIANSNSNKFYIDENNNTIKINNTYLEIIPIKNTTRMKHLHISCRNGVALEKLFNKKKLLYDTLSIDVMNSSIIKNKDLIYKLLPEINFLFCNKKEFQTLTNTLSIDLNIYNKLISFITHDKKGVEIILNNSSYFFNTIEFDTISSIGAGDIFLGTFLSCFVLNKLSFSESIYYSLSASSISVLDFGVLHILDKKTLIDETYNKIKKNIQLNTTINTRFPIFIIVLGSSCSGKSTFVDYFKEIYSWYNCIDDINPLSELFMIEKALDIAIKNNDTKKFYRLKNNLNYYFDIWNEYKKDIDNKIIKHKYAFPNSSGGNTIISPFIWDDIIIRELQRVKGNENYIFQFSRGTDQHYMNYKNIDTYSIYNNSLELIFNKINKNHLDNMIIIHIYSNYNQRIKRNKERFLKGGHYVSDSTMEKIYKYDIFKVNENHVRINNISVPIYSINNSKNFDESNLRKYFYFHINKILKF